MSVHSLYVKCGQEGAVERKRCLHNYRFLAGLAAIPALGVLFAERFGDPGISGFQVPTLGNLDHQAF